MARSEVLVDADWVEAHLDDPKVVLVEVDEDTAAYDKNHIKNASPVQPGRVLDVVLVVRRGVFVDLDEDDLRVVEVSLDPVGVDQYFASCHCGFSL